MSKPLFDELQLFGKLQEDCKDTISESSSPSQLPYDRSVAVDTTTKTTAAATTAVAAIAPASADVTTPQSMSTAAAVSSANPPLSPAGEPSSASASAPVMRRRPSQLMRRMSKPVFEEIDALRQIQEAGTI
jgi:hypothetical protein